MMSDLNQEKTDKIIPSIRQFIINNFLFGNDSAELNEDDSFLETGIIDSTGILELIQHIESEYEIKIDDSELVPENLDSLNNIKNFIINKKK
jgi:acyl carrier protein